MRPWGHVRACDHVGSGPPAAFHRPLLLPGWIAGIQTHSRYLILKANTSTVTIICMDSKHELQYIRLQYFGVFLKFSQICVLPEKFTQNSHLLYKFTINPTSLQGVGHKDKISFPPGLLRCSRHCLHRFNLPSVGAFLPAEETVMLTNSSTTIRWKCSQRKSVGGLRRE